VDTPGTFEEYTRGLRRLAKAVRNGGNRSPAVLAALDGQARRVVQQVLPIEKRQELGAFFSSSAHRDALWKTFRTPLVSGSVVLDPAVGAGDLLLGAVERAGASDITLVGFDIHDAFLEAARARLDIACATRCSLTKAGSIAIQLRHQSGLTQCDAIRSATHIAMNPPFTPMASPSACLWSSGQVNAAAVFVDVVCAHASYGAEIVAIVPDVLRSGARYARWRKHLATKVEVLGVVPLGRFDEWTDVDVALLHLAPPNPRPRGEQRDWGSLASRSKGERIEDHFHISVGAVVDYRSPISGPLHPYLIARDAPRWGTLTTIEKRRRFPGTVVQPPFVVIRRTSGPADHERAVGTLVDSDGPVAVENHLLVARPRDGKMATCKALLSRLRLASTSAWLNKRIACRHLTVGALQRLPWRAL